MIAKCLGSGKIAGSCFYHPRKSHISLGIMNVSQIFLDKGIAGNLLKKIIKIAKDQSLPVRLVSSAQNLDSFSLYAHKALHRFKHFRIYI